MQTKHNDGGPAFPSHITFNDALDKALVKHPGMTLRDWFAGQALTGLLTNYDSHSSNLTTCAELATLVADAILAELNKR